MNSMSWANANLRTLGDFDAFVHGDRVWRSSTARDHAARLAAGLSAMGVAPGDRVVLWLPNGPDLMISSRAVLSAGAVVVLAHHNSPLRRIEELAADTSATAIIASAAHVPPEATLPTVRHRIHTRADRDQQGWYSIERMLAENRPLAEPVPRSGEDIATIVFTSGTTGKPKGIVTRHGALTKSLEKPRRRLARWRRPVRYLAVLPMSSAFGNPVLFEGLGRKCTVHFLDRFDPQQVLETIERHRIQQTAFVPTMCEALLAVPDARAYDVSSLQSVICGGSHVSPDLIEQFRTVFGVGIRVAYGMSGIGRVSRIGSSSKRGSVGRLAPGLNARLLDSHGQEVPPGETGELVLRFHGGPGVEYWNPDSTVSSPESRDGWFRTGDLVRVDPDGEMYVEGRTDDLIIQGGYNINARSVSELIERLSGVSECAVVGVPDDYLGQRAVACVALREGARLTTREIIAHCRAHLEAGAVPADVWFVDALPRNESEKIMRQELRTAIRAARGSLFETSLTRRLANQPGTDRLDLLREEVQRLLEGVLGHANRAAIAGDMRFRDLGLDSLGAVELAHELSEVLGRPVSPKLVYTHPTVDAVCTCLLELLGHEPIKGSGPVDRSSQPPVSAGRIRLAQFFERAELAVAAQSAPALEPQHGSRVVLLTGANGFLGRFLTLEILQRLSNQGGRLYCLVRAPGHESALERLRAAYESDAGLLSLFEQLRSDGRMTVFGGDLTRSQFGLSDQDYARLCSEVDCIVHNAAVVDHVLGYRELFAPNVLGTVEIIRLALAERMKPINYVSTIAVRSVAGRRQSGPDAGAAAGYCSSKWASERLLKELNRKARIPVRIFRPSQIMAHSEYRGQINASDVFTRLLQGIATTSLVPGSFYATGARPAATHYDGLPVEVVARSIAALSVAGVTGRPGYTEYNIVNSNQDVDLDTITRWVGSAGYALERIEDYAGWLQAFRNRLSSLSRTKRQQSLLPLIHTWERPMVSSGTGYDTPVTREHLEYLAQSDAKHGLVDLPSISEAFVHKCLEDMRMLGLIDPAR